VRIGHAPHQLAQLFLAAFLAARMCGLIKIVVINGRYISQIGRHNTSLYSGNTALAENKKTLRIVSTLTDEPTLIQINRAIETREWHADQRHTSIVQQ